MWKKHLFITFLLIIGATFTLAQDDDEGGLGDGAEPPQEDEPSPVVEKSESSGGDEGANEKNIGIMDVFETCKRPFITQNYNPAWEKEVASVNENTTLYYPLLSKGHTFRLIQDLYQCNDFDKLKDSHLSNSCVRFTKDETGTFHSIQGYNGKKNVKIFNPIFGGPLSYHYLPVYPSGFGGRAYISLSDNQHFTVYVFCSDDGLGSFAVTSPEKTLSPEILNIAKEHVKALGFKEENFVEPNADLDCESDIGDVPVPKNYTLLLTNNLLYIPTPPRFHPNLLLGKK